MTLLVEGVLIDLVVALIAAILPEQLIPQKYRQLGYVRRSPIAQFLAIVSMLVFMSLPLVLVSAILWIDDPETAFLVVALAIVGAMVAAVFIYWIWTTRRG